MAGSKDPNIFTFQNTEEQLNQFLDAYHPELIMIPPDEPMRNFKARNLRVCRFCNAPAGTKKFKKVAHVIPESLGNKYLHSDFECDDCNALFGENENDLANWLGIARSILGTTGKNGIPTFKSANDLITARLVDFFSGKATKISTPGVGTDAINFDPKTGRTVIKYTKKPYSPIRVYKALLKMGLSMIPNEEVEQYRPAFKYLFNPAPNGLFDEFAKIMRHLLPMEHRFIKPAGMLYRKNDPAAKLPRHVFVLYYETYIYAFPLPFNELDWNAGLYKDLEMGCLFPPPIVFHPPHELSVAFSHNVNLSRYEKVVGEEDAVSFEMKLEDLKNMTSFDPKTGISKHGIVDPGEIVGMFIAPAGTTLDTTKTYENPFLKNE
ncbi:HNH endonuclease [Mucilaginibacter polytrichastri]|uniref:HNH endonuclease 5 domain-containing protein n=1 Tax=Mucilaginibacter polytrichastri TaxID=1302689 RepID=A0A1Q6A289_9SPHI|nr:HNH endonuclease [Mucilaginibacter polytrichastri]OKS88101.1 hypothetical protein RG47T_3565 [Mucilaginibacter polytrichastri]SFT09723.1 hypothetical protein SAMN04487890_110140 [Mucilaginibacter polytrichastri]